MAMYAQHKGPDFRSLSDLEAELNATERQIVECHEQLENLLADRSWVESTQWTPNQALRAVEIRSRPRAMLECPSAKCAGQTRAAESDSEPFPGWPKGTAQGDYKPRYENLKCDQCGSLIHTVEVFRKDINDFILRVLGVTVRVRRQVIAGEQLQAALRALDESRLKLRREIATRLLTGEKTDMSVKDRLMKIETPDVMETDAEWIDRDFPSLILSDGPEANRRAAKAFNMQREAATLRVELFAQFNETVPILLKDEGTDALKGLTEGARLELVRKFAERELQRRQG